LTQNSLNHLTSRKNMPLKSNFLEMLTPSPQKPSKFVRFLDFENYLWKIARTKFSTYKTPLIFIVDNDNG